MYYRFSFPCKQVRLLYKKVKLWWNNNTGRTQGFLQWKRKKLTRAWRWISCSQGHREHCHGMPPRLQPAHHHPPEGSSFQHLGSTNVRPNVRLWWQRTWEFNDQLRSVIDQKPENDILVVQGDWNSKVGKDALWKLARHLQTPPQWRNKGERAKTPGVYHF